MHILLIHELAQRSFGFKPTNEFIRSDEENYILILSEVLKEKG